MRLPLFAFLMCCGSIALEGSVPFYSEPAPFNFHLDAGFRQDNLKFRIGADESSFRRMHERDTPKTRSAVKWKDLKIAQIQGSFDYTTHDEYYIRANASYGRVVNGRARVENFDLKRHHIDDADSDSSDFIFPSSSSSSCSSSSFRSISSSSSCDRVREYSQQSADSHNGYVADLIGGVGYKAITNDGRGWVAAVGGYSFHRQSFEMTNFEQEIDLIDFLDVGPVPDLKGTYLTSWIGPWLGVDYLSKIEYDVTLYGSLEWHWAKYRADGHWNYTDAYKAHIRHSGRGYGAVARLGVDWTPCEAWAFGISGDYQIWSTKRKARNRATVFNDLPLGDEIELTFPVVRKSSLRRVRWNSFSINALVSYRF